MNVILEALSRFSRPCGTVSPKDDSYVPILVVAMTAAEGWSSRVLRITWIARGVLAVIVFVEAFGVDLCCITT